MRTLIYGLLLLNLVFFGWARWVDTPTIGHSSAEGVPALQLAAPRPAAAVADTPVSVASVAVTTVATAGAPLTVPQTSGPVAPLVLQERGLPPRCASLGPLTDMLTLGAVKTALQARNLSPRQRSTAGTVTEGYWVYIDNLRDSIARGRALRRLARGGVHDAAALASSGQVSVGLFSEKTGADSRAAAVRAVGLSPVIETRTRSATVYWFDVDVAAEVPLPTVSAVVAGLGLGGDPAWGRCAAP